MNLAYVYKWTHLPTMKWYIGSRTAKKCHPNDGYICSSKKIKPLILQNPDEWQRTIIATGSAEEMFKLETDILQTFDARNDPRSFNQHNNDDKFFAAGPKTEKHRANIAKSNTGKVRPGIGGRPKGLAPWNKGLEMPFMPKSKEHSANISKALKGKQKSIEHRKNNGISQLNRPKYNCPKCDKLISGMGNLKQHLKGVHKETI